MSEKGEVWIGADPGGKGCFGLAILASDGSSRTWSVDCADDARNLIRENVASEPRGIGVDAPLWWSSGPGGGRMADEWLRKTYRLSGGQVQSVNSLRGAALAQGMLFVTRIRELFPQIPVTETHPKAVLKALRLTRKSFGERFNVRADWGTEHEGDAVISAVAAREGFSGRWRKNLAMDRLPGEQDPAQFWLAPIHYFWPET
jgi:predicted nuclease with RNAse H fold